MSYDYKETKEEIIIDKGIATREMWKEYEHGKEHVSFEELVKACKIRSHVPVTLDVVHDHSQPLTDATKAIGTAILSPCPDKRGLKTVWRLFKDRIPDELLQSIRQRQPLPVSIYQFVNVDPDGEQRDLLFDHIAILEETTPRCPETRCGVGVYDGKMKKEEKKTIPDEEVQKLKAGEPIFDPPKPVQEPVQTVPPEESKPKETVEEVQPPLEAPAEVDPKDTEITKLQAQVKAIRDPLVTELVAKGFESQKLNPLDVPTLQLMVSHSRAATTQGLPGTVPAPAAEKPKTLDERVADVYKDAKERQLKATKEKYGNW